MVRPRTGGLQVDGGFPGLRARVQLVENESSSYTFNCQVNGPNDTLGVDQSTISYGMAGFEDLAYWFGWHRVGLYYSFLIDDLAGPGTVGSERADIQYDVTLAKSLLPPETPTLGQSDRVR